MTAHRIARTFAWTAGILLWLGYPPPARPSNSVPAALVGRWAGSMHSVVSFVHKNIWTVDLTIRPDGSVSGKIQDATIRHGQVRRLIRGPFLDSHYQVLVTLDGDLVSSEGIYRPSFRLFLNVGRRQLTGFGASSGWEMSAVASKEKMAQTMKIQTRGLKLIRISPKATEKP